MSASVFVPAGDGFEATEHATGPWDESALHGGALAALVARAFERCAPREGLRFARMQFELLRPIPAQGLVLDARLVRDGRRVQELAVDVSAGDEPICRASAMRVQEVPSGLPEPAAAVVEAAPMPGPEQAEPIVFALDDADRKSFAASTMEMRWLDPPGRLGPRRVWMRMRHDLLAGEPTSALARLAATADFGNGVGASLPFQDYVFINADLSVHLQREPRGEWIGLDAQTLLHAGGTGLAETVIHDLDGPVGRGFQSLVVQAR